MTTAGSAGDETRPNLYGFDRTELETWIEAHGAPTFHGRQIYRWIYERGVLDSDGWTDLPGTLRDLVGREAVVDPGTVLDRREAADGTIKFEVGLSDGLSVEAVHMVHSDRVTLCISSQVGCALACDFCLTGKMGLRRHLGTGEILGQVELIRQERALGDRPFNIVFMGMGEPLHNYDAVLGAFRILTDDAGFGLSRKRVTVSTSGLVPQIERLADEPAGPRLAVSLNATTDELRDSIMPINRKYPIPKLLEACRHYARTTGDRFTLEYVLLGGINDSEADVARLARMVRALPAKLNLIPFNAVEGLLDYRSPARKRVLWIRDRLLDDGIPVSIRWSRGADARAACGQLALLKSGTKHESRRSER
jgi:23S rRNA (adenine2503-C2)-methyltransferase